MGVRGGIDLGTTYSAFSWYDQDNNRVDTIDLESADGANTVRSVVYYPGPGEEAVIGETAWNAKKQFPDRVVVGIKRSMGMAYKTQPIDGVEYSPPQVSSVILKTLARDAEVFLGEEVKNVVITVPAHFGDSERAATEEAGQLAGLNVLGILPEPHAAALAFAIDKAASVIDRHLMVYDLGGGTFDVTLIHAKSSPEAGAVGLKIDTLCKDGNASLGGLDWDRALAEIVAEKAMQAHGVDVWQDPKNEGLLMDNCEKAKRHLSKAPSVSIVADMANHAVDVTREEFEDRTSPLLLQTRMLMEKVFEEAENQHGITRDKIDVLLAGGSTRMPMVRQMIQATTGKPPMQHGNPELLVTIGAAYWAYVLGGGVIVKPVAAPDGSAQPKQILVENSDTAMYAVGVEVLRPDGQGGMRRFNSVIVPKDARSGQVFEREFRVAEDDVTEIDVILYKGDSEDIDECEVLMTVTIPVPPGRPKGAPVKVKLGYDGSGIMRGKAIDVQTGRDIDIELNRGAAVAATA